jgi:thiamine pyrophosphokinase
MKKRCVIVSAGPLEAAQSALIHPEEDFILACDAGWRGCALLGVRPDCVVGDFDSAPQPDTTAEICVLPHEKNDTDTHYAARQAAAMGYKEVLMLGALGGARMEHTLANLSTALWLERQGIRVTLVDARSRVRFVRPGERRVFHRGDYFYFSVFPSEGTAKGVMIEGAHYPLTDATLDAAYPVGISNEYETDTIAVTAKAGFLTIIETLAEE